jgi:hypothetical protein
VGTPDEGGKHNEAHVDEVRVSPLKTTTQRSAVAATIAVLFACSGESLRSSRSPDTMIGNPPRKPESPASTSARMTPSTALPPGVTFQSGATIPSSAYVFRRVATPGGEMVWLDSVTQRTTGAPTRVLRAELRLPPLAADERVMLASCDVGDRLDAFVVAIVVNEPNASRFTKVRQAWRANPRARRFDILPVSGIVCEDPGT